ncbi:macrolide family glycosyltransferase [Umezawaea sp. NPDC059074]|uniref:macrolide family glycosyltransferase n=1 Tax=Umezawaea sp. NPDC059074 TaxID=3346716 RepID=UPI0036B57831
MHVAFTSVPAAGHVHPGLGLVAELARRGHRVSYATTEPFAERVAAAGADPVPYTPSPGYGRPVTDLVDVMEMLLDEVVHVLPQVEAAYRGDEPDVVVHDSAAHHAPVLADRWGVPAVQLNPTIIPLDGGEILGSGERATAFRRRYQAFLDAEGVTRDLDDFLFRPRRSIVTVPRSFQLDPDRYGDEFTFVGPLAAPRATGAWTPPDDRPVLLITLGSVYTADPEFFRLCLEAFGGLDRHVVLAVGDHVDPADLGPIPANTAVHAWVPQTEVLAHAAAFVTHAGMGGTMEALRAGVPLIAVPQAVDQLLIGPMIARLGVGEHLPRADVTVERLRAALAAVTTDTVGRRVQEVRREILALGGVAEAADIVEKEAHGV